MPRGSNTAIFAYPCVSAFILLLAPELLAIAVCAASAGSELDTIDIIDKLIANELNDAAGARTTVRAATLCRMHAGRALPC